MTVSKIFRGAFYSLKVLWRPKDIDSLLAMGDLLSDSQALQSAARHAQEDPQAQALFQERYGRTLPDLAVLAQMPADSLGFALFRHLEGHGLGLYPERSIAQWNDPVYLRERQRQIHDLIHVLLGLGIKPNEEAGVNAFLMAKTGTPISVLVVFGVLLRDLFKNPSELMNSLNLIHLAWQQGCRARSPFGYRWEDELQTPLAQVREAFLMPREGLLFASPL